MWENPIFFLHNSKLFLHVRSFIGIVGSRIFNPPLNPHHLKTTTQLKNFPYPILAIPKVSYFQSYVTIIDRKITEQAFRSFYIKNAFMKTFYYTSWHLLYFCLAIEDSNRSCLSSLLIWHFQYLLYFIYAVINPLLIYIKLRDWSTLFGIGCFGAAHGWGVEAKRPPLPKGHTYPATMKFGTVVPYLRKIKKI